MFGEGVIYTHQPSLLKVRAFDFRVAVMRSEAALFVKSPYRLWER